MEEKSELHEYNLAGIIIIMFYQTCNILMSTYREWGELQTIHQNPKYCCIDSCNIDLAKDTMSQFVIILLLSRSIAPQIGILAVVLITTTIPSSTKVRLKQ